MKMMMKKVDDKKIKSLWFNPWKYDRKEELWSALIQSILIKILSETKKPKRKRAIKAALKILSWIALKKIVPAITSGIYTSQDMDQVLSGKTSDLDHIWPELSVCC
jgi:hypothetical protein